MMTFAVKLNWPCGVQKGPVNDGNFEFGGRHI